MKEDKQKICDLLLPALQATRNLYDLQELEYSEERDLVYATFESGYDPGRHRADRIKEERLHSDGVVSNEALIQ